MKPAATIPQTVRRARQPWVKGDQIAVRLVSADHAAAGADGDIG